MCRNHHVQTAALMTPTMPATRSARPKYPAKGAKHLPAFDEAESAHPQVYPEHDVAWLEEVKFLAPGRRIECAGAGFEEIGAHLVSPSCVPIEAIMSVISRLRAAI